MVFGDVLDEEGGKRERAPRARRPGDLRAPRRHQRGATGAAPWPPPCDVRAAQRARQQRRHPLSFQDRGDVGGGLDRIMAVNVKGVFLGTKCAIPAMRRSGGGSIVNISSTAGLVGSPSASRAYTATKGAVRLFTKATAIQHARDNIRCNSVHPGPIITEMTEARSRPSPVGAAAACACPWAARARRKSRLRRALPRLRRVVVRDRQRAGHRRRVAAQ